MGNEVAKKQPFTTALAQIQDKFTNAVVNAGKAMNIQYNEYQSACMMNMLGKMQALAVENQLDILKMDYSQITNILQTVAMLNLNISAADEEIIRKAAKEINERVLKYKTGNTEPEPFYFLAYVSLLHTIKMLQQEQKFNEIEQINLKLDEFIKE